MEKKPAQLTRTLRSTGPEKKVWDVVTGTTQCNTTGFIQCLFLPVLGNDYNNRIGRKTTATSIYMRGHVLTEAAKDAINGAALAVPASMVRMILFLDDQPNGAVPALLDLLLEALPSSQLNINNRERFRILKDKTWVFDPYLAGLTWVSATNQIGTLKVYKKLNLETTFNATNGGTIADINSGALNICWLSNLPSGTDTDCNARYSVRVRFLDQ